MPRSRKGRPIVVLGARGLIGSTLLEVFSADSPLALNSSQCDLARPDQMLKVLDRLRPGIFINAAAMTNVDECERDPDRAMRLNAIGPGHLAQAAREIDCLLVHFSTDFIFDGQKDQAYREDDPPNPLSVYGKSKLAGEEAIQAAGPSHLIIRTAWVFGRKRTGFIWKILETAEAGRPLTVVDDQSGSPTFAPDLALGVEALIGAGARGVVNLVNSGTASRWDLARAALDIAGFSQVEIKRASSDQFKNLAPRPANAPLDNNRFMLLTGVSPRPWRAALVEALKDYGTEN